MVEPLWLNRRVLRVTKMIKSSITKNEFKILAAIDNCEYGDELTSSVWVYTVLFHSKIRGKAFSRAIAALNEKKLVSLGGMDHDATICITESGVEEYLKATDGVSAKKH